MGIEDNLAEIKIGEVGEPNPNYANELPEWSASDWHKFIAYGNALAQQIACNPFATEEYLANGLEFPIHLLYGQVIYGPGKWSEVSLQE